MVSKNVTNKEHGSVSFRSRIIALVTKVVNWKIYKYIQIVHIFI